MKILKEDSSNIRLDFKKAGFMRDPQHDFKDDGNRFQAYIHRSGMPMSYTSYQGDAYISLRPDYLGELNYKEYSKLPSYKDANIYNGVPKSSVDMTKLDQVATRLMDEYNEVVGNMESVSDDSLRELLQQAKDIAIKNYNNMSKLIKDNFDKYIELDSPKATKIKEYLQHLKWDVVKLDFDKVASESEAYKRDILNRGIEGLVKPEEDNFYCEKIKELMGL